MPTPRAHTLVGAARPHLQRLEQDLLSEEAFDPATSTRPIRLAISDVAELAFFSAVIDHFRRHAPQSQVRAVTLTEPQLRDALESGDADVAAGYYPALAAKSFRQRRLSRHGFACLMRAGHPLWKRRLTVPAYQEAEHIVIRAEGRSQELLERYVRDVRDAVRNGRSA